MFIVYEIDITLLLKMMNTFWIINSKLFILCIGNFPNHLKFKQNEKSTLCPVLKIQIM